MKRTPPPPKKGVTAGKQGPPAAGLTGTGSTSALSGTSGTSTTSSNTSTQWPSLSLRFNSDTPRQQQQQSFFTPHPSASDYAADPRNQNDINNEAATRFAFDNDKLQDDGSNIRNWLNKIMEFAIMSLDDPTFYDQPQPADAKVVMAADTRWQVTGNRWRVPVVCTGTRLRIPGAGAGVQASQKLNTRVPGTSQRGNQLGGAGCAAGPDHACLRSKTAAERDRMLL